MDSGNSGSMSSSGDEEYDSHADPWFLNHQTTHFGSMSQSQPQPSLVASMFDVSPNLECEGPRSQPNCTRQAGSLPAATRNGKQSLSGPNNKNSKKRSRASRRAPTTVLTTDTTNFRSMVQEFTGIPAPPFSPSSSSSSSFYSRRLPLVSTHSRTLIHNNMNIPSATTNNNHLPPHPSLPYHHPHNIMQNHPTLPFPSSSSLHTIVPTAPFGAKLSFDDDDDVQVNGRDPFMCLGGNYENTLENPSPGGEATVHSWISSSHQ
ncbi:hypothetical protein VNO77_10432 [Canavalia gladiata]|uniref:VQ domain-containing protein n=1 Tax=Canavalia gladiata TaxID=3824 RepID=A0AAN9MFU8_CANGL